MKSLCFQIYSKATVIKAVHIPKGKYRSKGRLYGPEIDPPKYRKLISNKSAQVFQWGKRFQQMVLEQLDIKKKRTLTLTSHHTPQLAQSGS